MELGVVGFQLAVFGMRQETPQVRPETLDPDTVRLSGVQIEVLGGGQEGGSLLPLAIPERSWWMELLPWEWRA